VRKQRYNRFRVLLRLWMVLSLLLPLCFFGGSDEVQFPYGGEMVIVQAGTFQMGNTRNDREGSFLEEPVHTVQLTYDFWIGKYPVTFNEYGVYCDALGRRPPHDGLRYFSSSHWGRETRPVINVRWWDAIAYCNWLSESEGLSPAYDEDGNLLDRAGVATTDVTKVEGYRLLTESEWEYAARGGHKSTEDFRYAGSHTIQEVAWYDRNSDDETKPVGQKKPNELGVYDMNGNVREWCYDWFDEYSNETRINPIGPSEGNERTTRGGGWEYEAEDCRVASRGDVAPDFYYHALGFRIARTRF